MGRARANATLSGAYPAHEAAGMPLGGQGRHVVLHYGPVATAALGREHVEVIVPAVRAALPFVESLLAELFAALSAEKVFRVPRLLQSRHTFLRENNQTHIVYRTNITPLSNNNNNATVLRPIWVRCSTRIWARTGCDSRVRSTAVRRVRRNSGCLTPGNSGCTWSAPGATSYPGPLSLGPRWPCRTPCNSLFASCSRLVCSFRRSDSRACSPTAPLSLPSR